MQQEKKYTILPADDAVQNWFEENIDKGCSASSAIYKFIQWLESMQPQHPVSAGWVKAADRLPQSFQAIYVRIEKVKSIASWHPHHERFIDDAGDFHPADQVEWLDETGQSNKEAVEFAEWILEQDIEPTFNDHGKGWVDYSKPMDKNRFTTEQLHEQYNQQKEGKP